MRRAIENNLSYPSEISPKFFEVRKYLINRIFDLGDSLDLRSITLQCAIIYIEVLLNVGKLDIIDKDKDLWSVNALQLAWKYIELDDSIPFIKEYSKLVDCRNYTTDIFIKSERVLLKALKWDLMVITPLHFTSCILNHCVLFGDDKVKIIDQRGQDSYRYVSNIEFEYEKQKKDQITQIVQAIKKYAEFFWDIAIQSFEIQKFTYAVQGVYAILAAREVLGIKPVWNKQLDQFTGLNKHKIKEDIQEVR